MSYKSINKEGFKKDRNGAGYVEYSDKILNFTIYSDGSGYVEIKFKSGQLHVDESGKHKDRIKRIEEKIDLLNKRAKILTKCVKIMKKHKYDIPE